MDTRLVIFLSCLAVGACIPRVDFARPDPCRIKTRQCITEEDSVMYQQMTAHQFDGNKHKIHKACRSVQEPFPCLYPLMKQCRAHHDYLSKIMNVFLTIQWCNVHAKYNRFCYGDVTRLYSGGRCRGGLRASHRAMYYDLPYLERYRSCYEKAADENCIQASVIAAIASRESMGGALIQRTGGLGFGLTRWGIMQCRMYGAWVKLDCKKCAWDSCCHISMMTKEVLVRNIKEVGALYPTWTTEMVLKGGIVAYNYGVKNVNRYWHSLDIGSNSNDYSSDVIARAHWLIARGWN